MTIERIDLGEMRSRSEAITAWLDSFMQRRECRTDTERLAYRQSGTEAIYAGPLVREWRLCTECRSTTCHLRTLDGHWVCHRALYGIMRDAGLYPGARPQHTHDASEVVREELVH